MAESNKEREIFQKLMELLDQEDSEGSSESLPYQIFCFPQSEMWVYDVSTRAMIRAFNKSEVVVVTLPDENDKVLVRYAGTFVRVKAEYICDIGFN
jgi:hypothetical protein